MSILAKGWITGYASKWYLESDDVTRYQISNTSGMTNLLRRDRYEEVFRLHREILPECEVVDWKFISPYIRIDNSEILAFAMLLIKEFP